MSLLTCKIKLGVGNPVPGHHLVGLITVPQAESTHVAGAFPLGKKEEKLFCGEKRDLGFLPAVVTTSAPWWLHHWGTGGERTPLFLALNEPEGLATVL